MSCYRTIKKKKVFCFLSTRPNLEKLKDGKSCEESLGPHYETPRPTMSFITYEQTEEILCRIDSEWDETEDSHRRIIVSTEQWKDLLWLAENTTYCRKDISTIAYSGYLYGSHPRAQSYHRRIQQTLLETGLDFYLIDWEEDLIQYALDVINIDIHSFDYYNSIKNRVSPFSFICVLMRVVFFISSIRHHCPLHNEDSGSGAPSNRAFGLDRE